MKERLDFHRDAQDVDVVVVGGAVEDGFSPESAPEEIVGPFHQ